MESKQSYPTIKDFVLQEAHQKAFEKLVTGLKDYEKEKARILAVKKDALHIQFEEKHKQNAAQRRIQKSAKINESRMKKMNARHQHLQELFIQAEKTLADQICKNETKYKALLKQLIVEGLIRLFEPVVYVRCLPRDKALIIKLIPQCKQEFQDLVQRQGIDSQIGNVDVKIDDRYSLTQKNIITNKERLKKSDENNVCFGGVIMTNEDGLIVCKNTLDARLELAYQQMLPIIRSSLYPS